MRLRASRHVACEFAQGRRFSALELVRRVTGDDLSPQSLLRYLRERYGAIYLS